MNARVTKLFGMAAIAAVACSMAACGGSSKSSAPPTTATTMAPSATAAGKPWVDALVASATNAPDKPAGVTGTQVHCLAAAIVDTYGAAAFPAAGYTIAKVEDPNSHLDKLPATYPQLAALGHRVQQCKLGAFIASALSQEFGSAAKPTTKACLETHLNGDSSAAPFLAVSFLNRDPDRATARGLVDVLAQCVDIGTVGSREIPGLTPAERACVAPKLAASSAFRDIIAEGIVGAKPTTPEILRATLDAMGTCLSPQRLAQLGRR